MIIVDVETGGLDATKNPLLSIGAMDYKTGASFYGECRTTQGMTVEAAALYVNGFLAEHITDNNKPSAAQLYKQFVEWANSNFGQVKHLIGGQQVGAFDVTFLHAAAGGKAEFEKSFSYRTVDLHSVAYAKFGESLSLDGILTKLGLAPEPKPHNALTGAKLERKAFIKLLSP